MNKENEDLIRSAITKMPKDYTGSFWRNFAWFLRDWGSFAILAAALLLFFAMIVVKSEQGLAISGVAGVIAVVDMAFTSPKHKQSYVGRFLALPLEEMRKLSLALFKKEVNKYDMIISQAIRDMDDSEKGLSDFVDPDEREIARSIVDNVMQTTILKLQTKVGREDLFTRAKEYKKSQTLTQSQKEAMVKAMLAKGYTRLGR